MHISLDSALGQQRRLNQVGESITQIAPNPAAAYSLRSLTGGDPKVVRVRRESDNHEQDFTASEVSSGALVDFVNTQVTAPLDIQALTSTGRDGDFLIAKAAYSLRSLGTRQATVAATGDTVARANGKYVCQVRSLTGDLKSFTADEVSDGTLVDFVLGNTASLVNSRAYFDGSSNYIAYSNGSDFSLSSNESFELSFNFVYVESSNLNRRILSVTDSSSNNNVFEIYKQPSASSSAIGIMFGGDGTAKVNTGTLTSGKEYLIKFGYDGSSFFCDLDGTTVGSSTETHSGISTAGNLVVGARHDTNQKASGVISNISFSKSGTTVFSVSGHGTTASNWTSDQSDSPTINGTLAAYTGQEMDGFVKTWYDQSVTTQAGDTATGNHITQATAASQPKIVSGGSLLNKLVFDGSDDFLRTSSNFDVFGSNSLSFSVVATVTSDNTERFFNARSGTPGFQFHMQTNPKIYYRDSSGNGTIGLDIVAGFTAGDEVLYTGIVDRDTDQNIKGFANGTEKSPLNVIDLTSVGSIDASIPLTVGANKTGAENYTGDMKEIIIYASNQTDNRTAIEANIGEHYSISGIPAFDNSVNGFVETWYDQSGNNNHAVQATASLQPKIVNAGSLLTAGVTFDGGDSLSVSGDPVITASSSGTFSAFSVQTVATSEAGYLYGNASTSNGSSLYAAVNTFALSDKTHINHDTISRIVAPSGGQNLLSAVYNDGDAGLLVNGAGTMTDAGTYDFSAGTGDFVIGNRNGGSAAATFLIGSINEIIIYNSNQSSNRTALETEIISHYGMS